MASIPITPAQTPVRRGVLARLGDAMRRHRRAIATTQWVIVVSYAVLVTVPALLPLPPRSAGIVSNLTLFAKFAFWGVWWPSVIASTMVLGRAWCGLFCPEGTLTEFASRHGLGRPIPRWMRWGGWPFVAFAITTVYGQLVSVYDYPKAVLLVLGGSTVAAMIVGFVYGRGKRVWCRHLCPANGVFELLAKVAPVHFAADEAAWKRYTGPAARVDCAPLVDLRHLSSASHCHACGRCSGHRNAIELKARSPNQEILAHTPERTSTAMALLLIFGVLGLALGAFQWTVSPWFVSMKLASAQWLVDHGAMALLGDRAPWWLLTHYPEANDVFTWLDGLCIVAYIGAVALVVGGATWLALTGAARLAGAVRLAGIAHSAGSGHPAGSGRPAGPGHPGSAASIQSSRVFDWKTLAMALIPLGGISLFLGLSMLTLGQLRGEQIAVPGVGLLRAALLAGGVAWSGWLGARIVLRTRAPAGARLLALACYAVPLSLVTLAWYLVFWHW